MASRLVYTVRNAVATIRFNNPKKYNAWTPSMIEDMKGALKTAATANDVKVAVVTGTGDYYCSGVDLSGAMKLMRPSEFLVQAKAQNQALFECYLDFPKPIIAAVNGPAIGASVTSASLCDCIIASDRATFHTPFKTLGITPEGCSSYWFPRQLGPEVSRQMLEEGKKLTADEAKAGNLAQKVVPHNELEAVVQTLAEEWAASGKKRSILEEDGLLAKLKEVNERESEELARAFMSVPFLDAMYRFTKDKNKTQAMWLFWFLKQSRPLWSKL